MSRCSFAVEDRLIVSRYASCMKATSAGVKLIVSARTCRVRAAFASFLLSSVDLPRDKFMNSLFEVTVIYLQHFLLSVSRACFELLATELFLRD